MKKVLLLFIIITLLACQKTGVEKPDNLIDRDKMITILYDISMLEAVKTQNIGGQLSSVDINTFIFKKYKIDSLQLVKSNKYYASDIADYKKMHQKVKDKLEEEIKKVEEKSKPTGKSKDTLKVEEPAAF
jgi:hypothetical protein